ncbi:hypothetical protein [Paractinoplanes ovalisporus]|uniref:hypothetical protein n=1 Tax=Paractinoplanes ovalisporus TaxID=2810368 RepID=UPI001F1B324D|nr:hypothetical protein [Actinoplanes ovalisporus]
MSGLIRAPSTTPVFLGLFPDPIAEGLPASWTIATASGPYQLTDIGPGTWHLVAYPFGDHESHESVARTGPIVTSRTTSEIKLDVALRPLVATDPPAVLSFHRLAQPHRRSAA